MKSKDGIVELLMEGLETIYCNTCRSRNNYENCDECNRKMMNWGISEDYAKKLADQIYKED